MKCDTNGCTLTVERLAPVAVVALMPSRDPQLLSVSREQAALQSSTLISSGGPLYRALHHRAMNGPPAPRGSCLHAFTLSLGIVWVENEFANWVFHLLEEL